MLCSESGNDTVLAENLGDLLKGFLNLGGSVCGHKAEADEGILRCYSRRYNGVDEDSFFEQLAGDCECLEVVADIEGDDRS